MLLYGKHWPQQRRWVWFAILMFVLATGWFFISGIGQNEWPSGSSLSGFTFGVAGGLICLFEFLLWAKKKKRTWRIGTAQAWMRAHIWLGLLAAPLVIYHSGFRLGGPLSAVLLILVLVVIASGIWGLTVQQFLPQRMFEEVPAETIYSQIDRLVEQMTEEAEQLVRATCGPAEGEAADAVMSTEDRGSGGPLVVGAVRVVGRIQGKVLQTRLPKAPVPASEPLRHFFLETVKPFLVLGPEKDSPLLTPSRSQVVFRSIKTRLPMGAHETVDVLEGYCQQRRQWSRQAKLQYWLHMWLWVHFPLSVALMVLLGVHIFVALKFW